MQCVDQFFYVLLMLQINKPNNAKAGWINTRICYIVLTTTVVHQHEYVPLTISVSTSKLPSHNYFEQEQGPTLEEMTPITITISNDSGQIEYTRPHIENFHYNI